MAPKRSAPPPPVESSEETASESEGSSSQEIAYSPPTATTKNTAPPPQRVQQPEASDGEEEEEDSEEEEEEEEEVPKKANNTAPSSAPHNPPQPPPVPEESDESGEEEDEDEGTDNEAPQPVSAPKQQQAEGSGGKRTSNEEKKPTAAPFHRAWSKEDDVRILEALAAHRREHGTLPQPEYLEAALAGNLDNAGHGLAGKVKSLKGMNTRNAKKVDLPSKDVDRRIFDLSKEVFGGGSGRPAPAVTPVRRDPVRKDPVRREFSEICKMYPYLAEEMRAVERMHPGLFKREFDLIDDNKARQLDQKIKKQRVVQMKLEQRRLDMTKEVAKTMMNLL